MDLLIIEVYDGLLFDIFQIPKKESRKIIHRVMFGYIDIVDFRSHRQKKMHLVNELKSVGVSLSA